MSPVLCSIAEAAKALGISRVKSYQLIREGRLETVRIGRRRLVLVASIHALAKVGTHEAGLNPLCAAG